MELSDDLPPPYEPDFDLLAVTDSDDPFMEACVELYKEVGILTVLTAENFPGPGHSFTRNEAVLCAMLMRVGKLCASMLAETVQKHGDQQLVLTRQILETIVNLVYLLDGDDERFDQYVQDSLVAEREFLGIIHENVKNRGEVELAIEERMRRSIEASADRAGVDLSSLPGRRKIGWPSVEQRLVAIGWADMYGAFRMGSNAIHGTWTDLDKHHLLEASDGGFEPRTSHASPQLQPLTATAVLILEVAGIYVEEFRANEVSLYRVRFQDLQRRLIRVDGARTLLRALQPFEMRLLVVRTGQATMLLPVVDG